MHLLGGNRKPPTGDGADGCVCRGADKARARVDCEVHARIEQRRGDDRHDRDERLEGHAAVADQTHIRLIGDELRCGAARDERVEARNRPARDRDEDERKHFAAEEGAGSIHEPGDRRHLQVRMHDQDGDREQRDHPQLQERRQVVTRGEQQPDRKDGSEPTVADDELGQWHGLKVEPGADHRMMIDPPTRKHREQDQRHAEQRPFDDTPWPPAAQIEADENGNRNRGKHRRRCPRAVLHRVDDHESEHRNQNDHDEQSADEGGEPAERSQLIARHLPQAASVSPCR